MRDFLTQWKSVVSSFDNATPLRQQGTSNFFTQLMVILAAGKSDNFSNVRGTLTDTVMHGRKIYAGALPLDGFNTVFTEDERQVSFVADSKSWKEAVGSITLLENEKLRGITGLTGYTSHDNDTEHFMPEQKAWDHIVKLKTPDGHVELTIITKKEQAGFMLLAEWQVRPQRTRSPRRLQAVPLPLCATPRPQNPADKKGYIHVGALRETDITPSPLPRLPDFLEDLPFPANRVPPTPMRNFLAQWRVVVSSATNAPALIRKGTSNFFTQLKSILAAGKHGSFSRIKGKPADTLVNGKKMYESTLPLDGFDTMITEDGKLMSFGADSKSFEETIGSITLLENEKLRGITGLTGYINHDNDTEHFIAPEEDWEHVVKLENPDEPVALTIITKKDEAGFTLLAE